MRPLRYSINVSLDGCCDHQAFRPDDELHGYTGEIIAQADALIFGRVIYEMMESAWRMGPDGKFKDWVADWMIPFATAIDRAKKYVVSDTLQSADWNAEIIRGKDLEKTIRQLKQQPGNGLYTGGVTLPKALAEMGLIDEYEFLVHPGLVGHGPAPFAGLSKPLDLTLIGRKEFRAGAVSLRYALKR